MLVLAFTKLFMLSCGILSMTCAVHGGAALNVMSCKCNTLTQKELLRREPALLKWLSCLPKVFVQCSSNGSAFSVLNMIDVNISDSIIVYSMLLQLGYLTCSPGSSAAKATAKSDSSAFICAECYPSN